MKKIFSCKWIFALLLVAFVAVGFSCSFLSDDDDDDDTPSNTPTTTTDSKLTAQEVEGVDGDYTIEETTYSVSGETVVTTGGEKQEVSALSSSKISFTILNDSGVSVTITIDSSGNITYTISGTTYSGTFSSDGSATLTSSSGEKIIAAKANGATINAILKSLGAQSTATSLKPSQTQPSSSAKVIIPSVNAVAWLSGTTIYYYAAGYTDSGKGIPLPADCSDMFFGCTSLTTIDMTGFDTSAVTDMYGMFRDCSALTSVDVSKMNTSNVTDMASMFRGCSSLTSIDVSQFDTSNVTNISQIFRECLALASIDVSQFDTSNVTDMYGMFRGCTALTSVDVSKMNTSNVTDMASMFRGCSSLVSLDVSSFDTAKVTDMHGMFKDCAVLSSIDVSNFDTSAVTDMGGMFNGCESLTTLNVSNFKTGNVTNMAWMFNGCESLTTLDVSNFDTSNVTDMAGMFNGCGSLKSLDLSNFNTSKVTDMHQMFNCCTALTSVDVSKMDTSNVTNMDWMFTMCLQVRVLDLSSFDTSKVTEYDGMFKNCINLVIIYVKPNSDWSSASTSSEMFYDCRCLAGGSGTAYDANHIDATYARVDGGTSAPGYFTAKTDGTEVISIASSAKNGWNLSIQYNTGSYNTLFVTADRFEYNEVTETEYYDESNSKKFSIEFTQSGSVITATSISLNHYKYNESSSRWSASSSDDTIISGTLTATLSDTAKVLVFTELPSELAEYLELGTYYSYFTTNY